MTLFLIKSKKNLLIIRNKKYLKKYITQKITADHNLFIFIH